jgi:prepilin-type processing-associated H-X9-DG protein
LDQNVLFGTVDRRLIAVRGLIIIPGVNDHNEPAKHTRLPIFLCPSDSSPFEERRNNYRVSVGVTAFPRDPNVPRDPPLAGAGPFYPVKRAMRVADYRDGLSQTMAFSERCAGDGDRGHFSPGFDYFRNWSTAGVIINSPQCETLQVQACASLAIPEPLHESTGGKYWFYAGFTDTWFNHLLTPNHPIPDCGMESGMSSNALMTARSGHHGGVNCLMMDGHVRFVSDSVDLAVWQAWGTRDGNETIDFD